MNPALAQHFDYLVDEAHRPLLHAILARVRDVKFAAGALTLHFEGGQTLSAAPPGADPGDGWPASFRAAVTQHATLRFPDDGGWSLVLGDHGNFEGAEKSPLRDFSDWWAVDAASGGLSFVSHEGGGPKKPVPASAGVIFVRRVAESLGLGPLPQLQEPVKRVELAPTAGSAGPALTVQQLALAQRKSVQVLSFFKNGTKLLAGSEDATLTVWDVATGAAIETWVPSIDDRKPVGGVGFKLSANGFMSFESLTLSRDEQHALTTHGDGGVRLWALEPIRLLGALPGGPSAYAPAAFSPDGAEVMAKVGRTVWVWRRADRAVVRQGNRYDDGSTELAAFSPDGSLLAFLADDFDVRVIDTKTHAEVTRIDAEHDTKYSNRVEALTFSPDGSKVLTGDIVGHVRTFEARSGALVSAFCRAESLEGRVTSLATAGETIAVGYDWDGVDLWSTAGEFLGTSQAKARVVALAPDGVTFATGASDGVVSLRREAGWCAPVPTGSQPEPKKRRRTSTPAPKVKARTGRGKSRSGQSPKRPRPAGRRGGARPKR